MAAKGEVKDVMTLKQVFQRAFDLYEQIESNDEPSNSDKLQKTISLALEHLAKATEMCNKLGLFSSNEELEEVSTSDIRFFLLPALSGHLTLCQGSIDRMSNVKIAKIDFIDFLKRCKDYGITDKDISHLSESRVSPLPGAEGLKQMTNMREEKIRRYKEQKQQETTFKEMKNCMEEKSEKPADEEIQREYYLLLIKIWINKSLEHLASIKDELEILEHMKNMKISKTQCEEKPRAALKPIKPILITKDSLALKAKVFGAGYPSLPTMSQEEFLEKEIREGKVVLEYDSTENTPTNPDDDEEEEEDNPDKLIKERAMDEWKDDHRRGWGNRENMG